MEIDFNKAADRRGTDSYKWDKLYERYGRNDLLPFWIADSELHTAQAITDGLTERAKQGIYGYTFKPDRYYEAITGWLNKRHQWETEKEWITSSPGVVTALSLCIQSYSEIGDGVIVLSPAYPSFYKKIEEAGRKLIISELVFEDDKFVIDFEDFEKKIRSSNCKLFIFCNPHNPTGRVWTKEELGRIGEICLKNHVIIVSDDIHSDIVYSESKYIPIAKLSSDLRARTITCLSAGKTFNITGLATAVIIIPNRNLREQYNRVLNRYELADGNLFGNIATELAYSKGEPWLDEMLKYIENNRDYLIHYLKQYSSSLRGIRPEGTFMALIDCSGLHLKNDELFRYFIDELGIVVNGGHTFGENINGCVRFNFSCALPLLKEGLSRLKI